MGLVLFSDKIPGCKDYYLNSTVAKRKIRYCRIGGGHVTEQIPSTPKIAEAIPAPSRGRREK